MIKAYSRYKPTKLSWLPFIPEDWSVVRGKFLFNLAKRTPLEDDGIVTAFRDGQVTLRSNRRQDGFTNALKEIGYQRVCKGDLVIHAMDAFAGAVGVSDSDGKSTPVYSCCIPNSSVNAEFYGYLVRNMALTGFIASLAKGIRERSTDFRWVDFSNQYLPFPLILEQELIVRFLNRETARIDSLISEKQNFIKLLKEKRKALVSNVVTKGLDPDVEMKDSGVEYIGSIPKSWKLVPLKYLCGFSGGGTPAKDNLEFWNGDIPWVSPKDMKSFWITSSKDKITEEAVEKSSASFVDTGAVLIVVRSGILRNKIPVAINTMPVTLNQDMKALRFKSENYALYFAHFIEGLYDYLLPEWRKQGATVESIEQGFLQKSLIPVPSKSEIEEINNEIGKRSEKITCLIEETQKSIYLLRERRVALISAAVTGKIDLRDKEVA
jgi:type I restriction enzyme S subunit